MLQTRTLGRQITASFEGCGGEAFADTARLTAVLRQVVKLLGFEEVAHISHSFAPQGSTSVLILAQSHIIAHTWPEYRALVIDLFACGEIHFFPAAEFVKAAVNAREYMIEERVRKVGTGDSAQEGIPEMTPHFKDNGFIIA
ncbi:adenosylmethionine decarboxylase [candidate division KSB3 bacterium]|uniref:Adenosylmethionine decarboxylase n=1 Tax=candidate division KSB3 bacterium TaxID=2044937 RepID=A0A2G6E3G0_9BACT|nr:MAG: adenosylmethionine decarboxylase [candidate division KSB3 bacterium]PIE28864.1 MAG: adenosylmethionine decarboxylase [candidate division KSB3 bacterium]